MGDELWPPGRLASSLLAYLSIGVFNDAQRKVGDADLAPFAAAALLGQAKMNERLELLQHRNALRILIHRADHVGDQDGLALGVAI